MSSAAAGAARAPPRAPRLDSGGRVAARRGAAARQPPLMGTRQQRRRRTRGRVAARPHLQLPPAQFAVQHAAALAPRCREAADHRTVAAESWPGQPEMHRDNRHHASSARRPAGAVLALGVGFVNACDGWLRWGTGQGQKMTDTSRRERGCSAAPGCSKGDSCACCRGEARTRQHQRPRGAAKAQEEGAGRVGRQRRLRPLPRHAEPADDLL